MSLSFILTSRLYSPQDISELRWPLWTSQPTYGSGGGNRWRLRRRTHPFHSYSDVAQVCRYFAPSITVLRCAFSLRRKVPNCLSTAERASVDFYERSYLRAQQSDEFALDQQRCQQISVSLATAILVLLDVIVSCLFYRWRREHCTLISIKCIQLMVSSSHLIAFNYWTSL